MLCVAACKATVVVHAFVDGCFESRARRDRYVTSPRDPARGKWRALGLEHGRTSSCSILLKHKPNLTLAVVFTVVLLARLANLDHTCFVYSITWPKGTLIALFVWTNKGAKALSLLCLWTSLVRSLTTRRQHQLERLFTLR